MPRSTRATSVLVPPMSKAIRNSCPTRRPPHPARAGAREERADRALPGALDGDDAAVGLGDVRLGPDAQGPRALAEAKGVATHQGPQVGVQHGRAEPLVFAELGDDLVGGADVAVWPARAGAF